jgi:hypothetical protein
MSPAGVTAAACVLSKSGGLRSTTVSAHTTGQESPSSSEVDERAA